MELGNFVTWGPRLVGMLFILTGLLKAISPDPFFNHLARLRVIPPRLLRWVTPALVVGECALGCALLVGLWPVLVWPASVAVLLLLAGVTAWSTATGRVEDCGCYQGLAEVTPAQSIALNGLYAALILLAIWVAPPVAAHQGLRGLLVLVLAAAALILFRVSVRRILTGRGPLFDLCPLKPGRTWKRRWLPAVPAGVMDGEHLLVFLSTTCPHCQRWVQVLNLVHRRPDLPRVTAVVVSPMDQLARFVLTEGARFPVMASRSNHVWATLPGVPTAVHLVDGVIQHRWVGALEVDFLERIRPGIGAKVAAHQAKMMEQLARQQQEISGESI